MAQRVGVMSEVHAGRELPRTRVVPYPSEQEARKAAMGVATASGAKGAAASGASALPSRYFQPLAEWTKTAMDGGATVFSTKFKVPFEWADRRPFLHVGSASNGYIIKVNGQEVGRNNSHATAAEFDLLSTSKEGVNTLEITVSGGEIKPLNEPAKAPALGEIYVIAQPRVRIRDYTISPLPDAVELGVIVKSHLLNPKTVRVYYSLQNPDGSAGPYGHRDANFEMKLEDTVRFFVPLPTPRLWSHETPHLYTLNLKLQHEGRFTEYICYRVGLRTMGLRGGQLVVNGRPVELTDANTLVLSAPVHDSIYARADRMGFYVVTMPDINTRRFGQSRARGGNPGNDPRWVADYTDRALTAYSTAQTHPSAAIFSLAADGSANGFNLYESYLAMKAVEPTRPIVYPVRGAAEVHTAGVSVDSGGTGSQDAKLISTREWNSDTLYFDGSKVLDIEHFTALKHSDVRAKIASSRPAVEITPLRDTIITDGKRQCSGRIYSLRNTLETADLRDIVVDWTATGRGVKARGTAYLKDALFADAAMNGVLRPGQAVEFVINFGKLVPGIGAHAGSVTQSLPNESAVKVTFAPFRPAEPFDPPTTDKRALVSLPTSEDSSLRPK